VTVDSTLQTIDQLRTTVDSTLQTTD